MVVRIRLARFGRKNRPFYRIVAIDSRKARQGQYLELVRAMTNVRLPVLRACGGSQATCKVARRWQ